MYVYLFIFAVYVCVFYMSAHVFVCAFVCTGLAGGAGPEEAVSVTGWVTIDV